MNSEQLSHEIIRMVYHEAVMSDDPIVQETCVQTSIQDLLEEFERGIRGDMQAETRQAEDDIRALELEIERQAQEIHDLKETK